MRFYTSSEIERLKAQATAIALNHGVRGRSYIERIAQLKGMNLGKDEVEVLRQLCEAMGVDYDKLEPIEEEGEK